MAMSIIETGEHKFKYKKKSRKGIPINMWCETWFETTTNPMGGASSKPIQKQKWLSDEEYKAL